MTQCIQRTQTEFGIWEQSAWESAELRPPGRGRARLTVDHCRLSWRPSPEQVGLVPADLCIEFDVYRGADGVRRFVPVGGYGPFLHYAWLVGLAILQFRHNLPDHQVFSYRAMKLAFDRVRVGREHLSRRFSAARDLYVRPAGRGGDLVASLLPEYVGRTADRGGHNWSIRELTARGRAAAVAAGFRNPTNDRAIPYGLTLAAEMNPLIGLDPVQVRRLIFTALFDPGEEYVAVNDATVADVTERLLVAVEEHGDDVWGRFQAWFSGRNNNLVQTLARKAGYPELPRETVKAALLQLGLQSYEYLAGCLNYFAQAMRNGLSEPLNEAERRVFDGMYLPQACYGGLPLVLLMERGDMLGPVLTRLWEAPGDEPLIGALHRLLQIYADLAPARRAADRRFKDLRRALAGRQADREAAQADQAAADDNQESLLDRRALQNAAHRLLRARREGCPECADASDWEMECELSSDNEVVVHVTCQQHDHEQEYRFTLEEMFAAVERGGDHTH